MYQHESMPPHHHHHEADVLTSIDGACLFPLTLFHCWYGTSMALTFIFHFQVCVAVDDALASCRLVMHALHSAKLHVS